MATIDVSALEAIPRVPSPAVRKTTVAPLPDTSGEVDSPSEEQAVAQVQAQQRWRTRPLSPEDLKDATARYRSGKTLKEIAAHYGMSRHFLTDQLRAAGVEIRNHSMSEDDLRQAIYRYGAGESLATIGAKLGFSAKTVWLALRKAGVPMRPRQGGRVGLSS